MKYSAEFPGASPNTRQWNPQNKIAWVEVQIIEPINPKITVLRKAVDSKVLLANWQLTIRPKALVQENNNRNFNKIQHEMGCNLNYFRGKVGGQNKIQ